MLQGYTTFVTYYYANKIPGSTSNELYIIKVFAKYMSDPPLPPHKKRKEREKTIILHEVMQL